MEQQLERQPPPAYASHDPDTLHLPSVPQHDPYAAIQLPDIKSLGLPSASEFLANGARHTTQWQSPPAQHILHAPRRSDVPRHTVEVGSPAGSVMSLDNGVRPPTSMNVDDPETRMAAEALSALGNLDFVRSPPTQTPVLSPEQQQWGQASTSQSPKEQQPLLSLLTASHPWVGNTINGSLTAYETTKYYSPAFVRSGAEFVERNIGSPISNTVGSISRRTGVEAGVRRYLGQRRPSDQEVKGSKKRRRTKDRYAEPKDVEMGLQSPPTSASIASPRIYDNRSRAGSQASLESLPAYDDNISPSYEERPPLQLTLDDHKRPATATATSRSASHNWRSQLLMTTSGLGAALSESSLRSLRYCLSILSRAFDHVTTIANALRSLLADYEAAQNAQASANGLVVGSRLTAEQQQRSQMLAEKIKDLGQDILKTVQGVVNTLNVYTGGALPENAAALVRRQVLSIPHRMRAAEGNAGQQQQQQDSASDGASGAGGASTAGGAESVVVRSGKKWLDFASQSLDMIEQVNLVLSGTIRSAERWLKSMGKNKEVGQGEQGVGSPMGSVVQQSVKSTFGHPAMYRDGVNGTNGVDEKR